MWWFALPAALGAYWLFRGPGKGRFGQEMTEEQIMNMSPEERQAFTEQIQAEIQAAEASDAQAKAQAQAQGGPSTPPQEGGGPSPDGGGGGGGGDGGGSPDGAQGPGLASRLARMQVRATGGGGGRRPMPSIRKR